MWYYVYILRSEVDGSFYIGYTSDLKVRIKEHNSGKTKSIQHKIPFKVVYCEAYNNKTIAIKREKELKSNRQQKMTILCRIFPDENFKL